MKKKVIIFVLILAGLSLLSELGIADKLEAGDYAKGVECILANDFDGAVTTLDTLSTNDSKALYEYATCRANINSYSGDPQGMLDVLNNIKGIENEEVKAQYNTACEQLELSADIQSEINSIDISSSKEAVKANTRNISKKLGGVSEEFKSVIDTSNYDIALALSEHKKNNTKLWKLVTGIDDIGEVSPDSKEYLQDLRKTYESLEPNEKQLVINYDALNEAEKAYDILITKLNCEVWITETGDAYHIEGCGHLKSHYKSMTQLEAIKEGYGPCSECMTKDYVVENWTEYR